MGVRFRVAVTGEMLDAACNARVLQSLQVAHHHWRGHLWVVGEGAVADDDVLRVGVDVGHWRKVDVDTIFSEIATDDIAGMIGVGGVVGLSYIAHGTDYLHVEVRVLRDAGDSSTFFVDAQQRLSVELAYVGDDGSKLRLVFDVPCVENDAADRILGVKVANVAVHLQHGVLLQVGIDVPVHGSVERFQSHVEHLSHLFAQCHFLQLGLYLIGRHRFRFVIVGTRGQHESHCQQGRQHGCVVDAMAQSQRLHHDGHGHHAAHHQNHQGCCFHFFFSLFFGVQRYAKKSESTRKRTF